MKTQPTIDLVDTREVAAILGVSVRRVSSLALGRPDFPPPVYQGGPRGRVWRRKAIVRWAATADRSPGRRNTPTKGPRR